jgi:hypothetical protein
MMWSRYGMGASEKAAARVRLANKATHALQLRATIPALGLATFMFKRISSSAATAAAAAATVPNGEDEISNGVYTLRLDREAGLIVSLTNEALKRTIALNVTCERTERLCSLPPHDRTERQAVIPVPAGGWYRSSEGGCTGGTDLAGNWVYDLHGCSDQASGA